MGEMTDDQLDSDDRLEASYLHPKERGLTETGRWLADWMADDGAVDRLPDGWDDPHALIQKIGDEARADDDGRCDDRCGGRAGHVGPHQSGDYDQILYALTLRDEVVTAARQTLALLPDVRAQGISRLKRALDRLDK